MTTQCLSAEQSRAVQIISALGFGVIHGLRIRDGSPCFVPETRIVQMIKLESHPQPRSESNSPGTTMKTEFQELFEQLNRVAVGIVDIEVRHGFPFRLIVEWSSTTFLETLRSSSEERP